MKWSGLCLALLAAAAQVRAGPTVTVRNGTYEGYSLDAVGQHVFLGIPYAQPPVGPLRFRAPQSLNSTWTGTKPATEYGNVCMQYVTPPSHPMSEDCLTINVIRPSGYANKSLPVAVWIHGGGLYSGSSADVNYNLTSFVYQSTLAGKPLVAVSLNYRLSAFGFLWSTSDPEVQAHGSANNGLRDQRLALAWVQENIGAFGGDPAKVTIWGQSSGGLSVGKHLIAYGGRDDGLFRGAIMQSGGMVEKWPYNIQDPAAYTDDLYRNLTVTTGCASSSSSPPGHPRQGALSTLECLRALPVEQLSAALNVTNTPVFSGTGLGPWLTQVDGDFLQDGPSESLQKGHFVPVPILYTACTDEATVFGYGAKIDTDADFRGFVTAGGPDAVTVSVIETLYPDVNAVGLPAAFHPTDADAATLGKQYKRAVAFHTDVVETASRRKTLDVWARAGATAYSARHDIWSLATPPFIGSSHGAEMAFVFHNVDGAAYQSAPLQGLADLMSRTWVSFVVDLDPNNHGVAGIPYWPSWNTNADEIGSNFVFAANGSAEATPHVELDDYRLAQTRYLAGIFQSQMYY